eukprot:jgi/Tetstr1/463935/TSEL_008740.t1
MSSRVPSGGFPAAMGVPRQCPFARPASQGSGARVSSPQSPLLSLPGSRPQRAVGCQARLPSLQEALLAPLSQLRLAMSPAALQDLRQVVVELGVRLRDEGADPPSIEGGLPGRSRNRAARSLAAFAAALAAGEVLPPALLPARSRWRAPTLPLGPLRMPLIRRPAEYTYELSFDQHGGAPPPGELAGAALAGAFLGGLRLAAALAKPQAVPGGLSAEAAALAAVFRLGQAGLAASVAAWEDEASGEAPSLASLRAPFLGVATRHVWADHAVDIAVSEEAGLASDGVWVWSRAAAAAPHKATAAILYVHGGGFVSGDFFGFRSYCYFLSAATGLPVLFCQYRRPPEHGLASASVTDVAEAARLLASRGMRSVVVGDSAGGGLALLAMQRLAAEAAASRRPCAAADRSGAALAAASPVPGMPVAAVLFSPWVDLTVSGPAIEANVDSDVVLAPGMLRVGRDLALVGHLRGPACPSVSPLFGRFAGLPPMLVSASSNELLYGDTVALCDVAAASGVAVTEDIVHDLFHTYQLMYPYLPESCAVMERVATWVAGQLGTAPPQPLDANPATSLPIRPRGPARSAGAAPQAGSGSATTC